MSEITARAVREMTAFYSKTSRVRVHDINHFLKVWGFARTIGLSEGLDPKTQKILELAAIAHDIACPLCREKYGNTEVPFPWSVRRKTRMQRETCGVFSSEAAPLFWSAKVSFRLLFLAVLSRTGREISSVVLTGKTAAKRI